jgi:hypothetical protein
MKSQKVMIHSVLTAGRENYYRSGEAIGIHIDSARFLPENVGPTMILGRVVTGPVKPIFTFHTEIELDTPAFNPEYKSYFQFIPREIDGHSKIQFKLLTLETTNNEKRLIGTATIRLTLPDSENRAAPYFFVNRGCHQIPISYSKEFLRQEEVPR